MKTLRKSARKVLAVVGLLGLSIGVFAQASCTIYHVNCGAFTVYWSECSNPDSNTWWVN